MYKFLIITFMTLGGSGCQKQKPSDTSAIILPVANGQPVTLTINQNQKGYQIAHSFTGLSFETSILAKTTKFLSSGNPVLVQLIKNLGSGILRIGGNSSDATPWSAHSRNAGSGNDSLYTSDIDSINVFAKALQWPVIFGLNLGSGSAQAAANEAAYVTDKFKDNLSALQIGNEADLFFKNGHRTSAYTYAGFLTEWSTFFNTIKNAGINAAFAGPDVANNTTWISSFADNENQNIIMLDGHYYKTGPGSDASITYKTILTPDTKLSGYLAKLNTAALKYKLPYRITECNNIYSGGRAGVSDVFASALWALDFMWTVAENNGQGINFHGSTSAAYSPIVQQSGVMVPRPEYYAMLAFKYGSTDGIIVPATLSQSSYNCTAYASIAAGTTNITLINKEETVDISFTINLSNTANKVTIARLTAPGLTATSKITFAGNAVNSDGTFTPSASPSYSVSGKTFAINVPAGSAAVISVQ